MTKDLKQKILEQDGQYSAPSFLTDWGETE